MPFQKGNKYGGRRNRKSVLLRTPTPPQQEEYGSDEEMIDAEDAEMEDGEDAEDDEGDAGTPAQGEDGEDGDTPPTITAMPRRRRGRGGIRQGISRRSRGASMLDDNDESESGTPRRKRGRPFGRGTSRGGLRGRRRVMQAESAKVVDKEGNVLDVIDDEAVVDNDEEGNTKVDENGNLQGRREYRVRTFKIVGKEDRLYMLSTEPARCCGFRDSYLFFTKHPKLYKVVLGEEQKKELIRRDILPSSYKGRNIGVVTARSVFREFGSRIIVGGRKVIDDYKVEEAKANGEVEGELADPADRVPNNHDDYNRNRYVAWFGASDIYRQPAGAGSGAAGKPGMPWKRKSNVTRENWQLMHAREASRFNSAITSLRRANLNGVYETNTNTMFFPQITQPTHVKWEHVSAIAEATSSKHKSLTNGDTAYQNAAPSPLEDNLFTPVPPIVSRNFAVTDTYFLGPPHSHAGYPGPDGSLFGPNGLPLIVPDELPESCRAAYEAVRDEELAWKRQWGTERQSALRGNLKVGFNGYPV